ncbi:MAG: hypothetical protein ACR2PX_27045 [Endozoicomonas sp.]|uniref:hypothetical protein n=1 Tax=Endozoicomonas sp. TaxID=1892382 RepID=UPI003D9B2164
MNPQIKSKLLKRKFQSLAYIEQFIEHYQQFIDTGLNALAAYKNYKKQTPAFVPTKSMETEEWFWDLKVKPNFLSMKLSSKEALQNAKLGKKTTVRSLAGDFRGLSRGMDGIRETFMEVPDPLVRKKYLALRKTTSTEASNIEITINQWWKDGEILRETITGPIDEQELLNYLKPGESI